MAKSDLRSNNKKIRYAIVGLGHISQVAALPGFQNAKENSELVAFVSGDLDKAAKLEKKYPGVDIVSYEDYEGYLKSGRVDAAYIALPNDMHYEYAKKTLLNGVHVLSEKPFTLKSSEARELYQLAERKKLKLMVAYRLHFEASNLKALELANSGKIGELKSFNSSFSFQVTDPNNIRLKKSRGGGPLWDIGIYCINAARYIFRDEPTEVSAFSESSEQKRFSEIDETISVMMRFPNHRLATFTVSFGTSDAAWYTVYGSKGYICLDNAYEYAEGRELEFDIGDGPKIQKYKKADQFGPEFVYFSECIIKNRVVEPSGREGYADILVIEAIQESLRTGRAVHVRHSKVKWLRPHPRQKIFRFAVRKPDEVKVKSPHD